MKRKSDREVTLLMVLVYSTTVLLFFVAAVNLMKRDLLPAVVCTAVGIILFLGDKFFHR
jgi:hypothetical protein